ncbi:MAG: UDP-N-acetylmuramate dehydrogenase, partial [Planctomycetota bacterium]|nr:UDP-N-acetylmuramate dehydrogenase [Planctomycetota bacterium]
TIFESDSVVYIDDYAHHPTAVSAVIETAHRRFPGKRVIAVFEPHQHNRTRRLFEDFKAALGKADRVLVTDIFRCRDADDDVEAVGGKQLAKAVYDAFPGSKARHVSGQDAILHQLRASVKEGDTVLFMGAGTISSVAQRFAAMGRAAREQTQVDAAKCAASGRVERPRFLAAPVESIVERELGKITSHNESLSRYTSFRAGGKARYFLRPRTLQEAVESVTLLRKLGIPFHLLGGGSNTLFRDGTFPGAVIATRQINRITMRPNGLYTECGALLQKVIHRAEILGYAGLEGLAGIPATMGGAVTMNAGGAPNTAAVGDYVARVQVLEADGSVRWIDAADANFSYRKTELNGRMVLAVELSGFSIDEPGAIRARRFAAARKKAAQQPLSLASAGCVFRNPTGDSAGRLIDSLGFKGFSTGSAEVSDRHANFIINRDGASANEIIGLIETLKKGVFEKTGQSLEMELQVK